MRILWAHNVLRPNTLTGRAVEGSEKTRARQLRPGTKAQFREDCAKNFVAALIRDMRVKLVPLLLVPSAAPLNLQSHYCRGANVL